MSAHWFRCIRIIRCMITPDFQLKGSTVTVVVLELHHYSPEGFPEQLRDRIASAPGLFQGSPVVVNLEQMESAGPPPDLAGMLEHCRAAGLRPIAFRGAGPHLAEIAEATGLALLATSPQRERRSGADHPAPFGQAPFGQAPFSEPPSEPEARRESHAEPAPGARPTRTITRPIRSGQQVYAEGGDLIVLSPVSEGAEVLADGNIHIYGPLRGRALAGVHGDVNARIFCQHLDAELISVAGHFLLSDAITGDVHCKPAQIALEGEALHITAL
jgi:septum site-determining protein MinC